MDSKFGHNLLPVSAIIPTYNRSGILKNTFESIAAQNKQPYELIIIDASDDSSTYELSNEKIDSLYSEIVWVKAIEKGAAGQRNQGINVARCNYILLMDDDILLEPKCLERLWKGINSKSNIGGVNALITNQKYSNPGKPSLTLYRFLNGKKLPSYAGKCIGPGYNLAPEDNENLPELVKVDWINSGCTIYIKESLPSPVFPDFFKGYSMMEDLYLSLMVGKKWKLYNVRTAKIFHDSQPGEHKKSVFKISKMELINRHYIMYNVLEKRKIIDYVKLLILELFMCAAKIKKLKELFPYMCGKFIGFTIILYKNKKVT